MDKGAIQRRVFRDLQNSVFVFARCCWIEPSRFSTCVRSCDECRDRTFRCSSRCWQSSCVIQEVLGGIGEAGLEVFVIASHLGLKECHNKIKVVFDYKLNFMTTINSKGERQLSQSELLPLIQSYLGASLFKHALHYQSITQTHAPYLDFVYEKVPLQTNLPTPQEKYVFASLFKDVQAKMILNIHLLRIVQCKQTLLCLVLDNDLPLGQDRFFIIAIVFQNKAAAAQWRQEYSFLTLLKVSEPYRSRHKISMHSSTTLLVTRIQNIKVEARFKLQNYSTDKVRSEGNQKFREKKYIDALYDYEFGLGLAHSPDNRRQRAILYANSSQCLFEMRLFQSALLYADTSSSIDRKYAKGIYRKYACYLELGELKQVPTVLRAINSVCTQGQFQTAQKMFSRTSQHHHGLFDWKQIFRGQTLHFSQYLSSSIKKVKDEGESFGILDTNRYSYIAQKDISQFEMIMLSKPLIYCNSEQQKFGQNYSALINQIMTYCDLQDNFYQKFQDLPSQCTFQGHILKYNKYNPEGVQMNQIHAKCLRCLQLQKVISLAEGQKQCLGIWDQLYRFKHDCYSNCTFLHIKGGLAVFAVQDIKQGQPLTVDFLSWQTIRRDSLMLQKLGISCECQFCKWQWDMDISKRSGELLYSFFKHEISDCLQTGNQKLSLFYLWNLIFVKKYKEVELMKEYLLILQKYPVWECIINCLKYLRARPRNDVFDHIKSMVKKFFEKYFKMGHHQAVQLLKLIL